MFNGARGGRRCPDTAPRTRREVGTDFTSGFAGAGAAHEVEHVEQSNGGRRSVDEALRGSVSAAERYPGRAVLSYSRHGLGERLSDLSGRDAGPGPGVSPRL